MNDTNPGSPPELPPAKESQTVEPQQDTAFSRVFEGLLKSPEALIAGITANKSSLPFLKQLLLLAFSGIVVFGITLGSFAYHEQLWAAPLKTTLGLAFSALICLPSLYIFSALTGTRLGFKEIAQGLAGSLALIGTLLLGFTPVLWVFSQSTYSTAFFGTLVLVAWLIALFFGAGFLVRMLEQSGNNPKGPLRVWIGIFLLVCLQMSTSLRPLIGRSDTLFTTEKRFFLEHWGEQLAEPPVSRSARLPEPAE